MAKIPWNKIKTRALASAGQLWNDEEKEMRKIIDDAPEGSKVITVSFSFKIDCGVELPTVKTKIGISKGKITAETTASIDDPDQMELGDKEKAGEKPAEK